MVYKVYLQLHFYIIGLLIALQTVVTYDLRDSLACSSFYRDDLNVTTYSSNSTTPSYYRFLTIDPVANILFVGSMNKVTILDLDDISTHIQVLELNPDSSNLDYCKLQKQEIPYCQNHIRFITKTKESEYFLCGTHALNPAGYQLKLNGNTYSVQSEGRTACSDDPFSNFTAIHVKSGNPEGKAFMYYGSTAFAKSSIYRPIYKEDGTVSEFMKGVFSNKWMKEPQFAGSFDVEDRVFFFFREVAIETEKIEHKLYSRVGKICKKDIGGDSVLRYKWTSYQKARLNCSLPGTFPTYFDVIQDVATIDHKTFFGLFTTYTNGLPASAICAFDKEEIDRVLNVGPFKTQSNDMSYWTEDTASFTSPRPGQCTDDSLKIEDTVLGFIADHPLMHYSVQQKYGKALFYLPGQELQQLEMEGAPGSTGDAFVFYAGSNRGHVYKIFTQDKGDQYNTHVSNIYSPFEQTEVIWSLKHHDKYVYLGTDHSVVQINVQNDCLKHKTVDSCVYDPHCVWAVDACDHHLHVSSSTDSINYNTYIPPTSESELNEFTYRGRDPVTKVEFLTLKMELNNKNICALGRNIVWKKKSKLGPNNYSSTFVKLKLDDNHFVDSKNSLIISDLTETDNGIYQAYDTENSKLIAAKYTLDVATETNFKRIYKAKFDDWCEYFDKGKHLQEKYTKRCNINV